MGLSRPVVHQVPPGHALPGRGQVHPDDAPRVRVGALHRQLQGAQGPAGVSPGHARQVVQGLSGNLGFTRPQPPVFIPQSPPQDSADVCLGERLEDEDPGPGQERPDNLEIGVFGGGPHQGDQPFLHVRQQGVLLGLVEPVDLVDQDHGAGPLALVAPGFLHHPPQVGHPGHHRAQADKVAVEDRGHNPGQGSLAAPRGAPEDHGGKEPAGLEGPPQQTSGAHQVRLAHKLIQGPGPHPGRQGRWGSEEGGSLIHKPAPPGWRTPSLASSPQPGERGDRRILSMLFIHNRKTPAGQMGHPTARRLSLRKADGPPFHPAGQSAGRLGSIFPLPGPGKPGITCAVDKNRVKL